MGPPFGNIRFRAAGALRDAAGYRYAAGAPLCGGVPPTRGPMRRGTATPAGHRYRRGTCDGPVRAGHRDAGGAPLCGWGTVRAGHCAAGDRHAAERRRWGRCAAGRRSGGPPCGGRHGGIGPWGYCHPGSPPTPVRLGPAIRPAPQPWGMPGTRPAAVARAATRRTAPGGTAPGGTAPGGTHRPGGPGCGRACWLFSCCRGGVVLLPRAAKQLTVVVFLRRLPHGLARRHRPPRQGRVAVIGRIGSRAVTAAVPLAPRLTVRVTAQAGVATFHQVPPGPYCPAAPRDICLPLECRSKKSPV